jgi:hypothetical protein
MAPPPSVDIHVHDVPERFFAILDEAGQPFGAASTAATRRAIIDLKGSRPCRWTSRTGTWIGA